MAKSDTFTIDGSNNASFASFNDAVDCAVVHARQRGEAIIRTKRAGLLLADLRKHAETGEVGITAIGAGKALVADWVRARS